MKKESKWNEQAAMNNNLGSSTIQMNESIAKQHERPKTAKSNTNKKSNTKFN